MTKTQMVGACLCLSLLATSMSRACLEALTPFMLIRQRDPFGIATIAGSISAFAGVVLAALLYSRMRIDWLAAIGCFGGVVACVFSSQLADQPVCLLAFQIWGGVQAGILAVAAPFSLLHLCSSEEAAITHMIRMGLCDLMGTVSVYISTGFMGIICKNDATVVRVVLVLPCVPYGIGMLGLVFFRPAKRQPSLEEGTFDRGTTRFLDRSSSWFQSDTVSEISLGHFMDRKILADSTILDSCRDTLGETLSPKVQFLSSSFRTDQPSSPLAPRHLSSIEKPQKLTVGMVVGTSLTCFVFAFLERLLLMYSLQVADISQTEEEVAWWLIASGLLVLSSGIAGSVFLAMAWPYDHLCVALVVTICGMLPYGVFAEVTTPHTPWIRCVISLSGSFGVYFTSSLVWSLPYMVFPKQPLGCLMPVATRFLAEAAAVAASTLFNHLQPLILHMIFVFVLVLALGAVMAFQYPIRYRLDVG